MSTARSSVVTDPSPGDSKTFTLSDRQARPASCRVVLCMQPPPPMLGVETYFRCSAVGQVSGIVTTFTLEGAKRWSEVRSVDPRGRSERCKKTTFEIVLSYEWSVYLCVFSSTSMRSLAGGLLRVTTRRPDEGFRGYR